MGRAGDCLRVKKYRRSWLRGGDVGCLISWADINISLSLVRVLLDHAQGWSGTNFWSCRFSVLAFIFVGDLAILLAFSISPHIIVSANYSCKNLLQRQLIFSFIKPRVHFFAASYRSYSGRNYVLCQIPKQTYSWDLSTTQRI